MPKSLDQSGWYGVAMIIICCLISAYCGIRLSSCWMMIINKNESLKHGTRDPFLVIAYESAGLIGRLVVLTRYFYNLLFYVLKPFYQIFKLHSCNVLLYSIIWCCSHIFDNSFA